MIVVGVETFGKSIKCVITMHENGTILNEKRNAQEDFFVIMTLKYEMFRIYGRNA